MAYLSVPSPGKWISDIFEKHIVLTFFRNFGIRNSDIFFEPPTGGGGRAAGPFGSVAVGRLVGIFRPFFGPDDERLSDKVLTQNFS